VQLQPTLEHPIPPMPQLIPQSSGAVVQATLLQPALPLHCMQNVDALPAVTVEAEQAPLSSQRSVHASPAAHSICLLEQDPLLLQTIRHGRPGGHVMFAAVHLGPGQSIRQRRPRHEEQASGQGPVSPASASESLASMSGPMASASSAPPSRTGSLLLPSFERESRGRDPSSESASISAPTVSSPHPPVDASVQRLVPITTVTTRAAPARTREAYRIAVREARRDRVARECSPLPHRDLHEKRPPAGGRSRGGDDCATRLGMTAMSGSRVGSLVGSPDFRGTFSDYVYTSDFALIERRLRRLFPKEYCAFSARARRRRRNQRLTST